MARTALLVLFMPLDVAVVVMLVQSGEWGLATVGVVAFAGMALSVGVALHRWKPGRSDSDG